MDEGEDIPEQRLSPWHRAFDDPEVEQVMLLGETVLVRLRSGVELEWRLDEQDPPKNS